MAIVSIKEDNIHLLKDFIENMGTASKSFRYYNSRSVEVIKNHLATLLIVENDKPIAYGHLDTEDNVVWLGVCVLPAFLGKGHGNNMMSELLKTAKKMHVLKIQLTVDKDNKTAISLYEKFNFKKERGFEDNFQYGFEF